MVSGLLDTDILVDLLRQHPPAHAWANQQSDLGVTIISWIELLQGSPNKQAQQNALGLLHKFKRIEVEKTDFLWTIQGLLKYNLSHNMRGFDGLIASVSYRLGITLYTRNLKHFRPILGNLAQNPY
jgi:predicted nucleic acid-binding protein